MYNDTLMPDEFDAARIRTARKRFSKCALGLFLYVTVAYAVSFLVSFVLQWLGVYESLMSNVYFTWLMSTGPMYLVGLPVFCLFMAPMKKKPPKRQDMHLADVLLIFLISRAFMLVGSLVSNGLVGAIAALRGSEIPNQTQDMLMNAPMLLILLVVVIIGPLVEELVFRKYIIDRLRMYGDKVAILFSSVLFGIAHGNFYQFLYSFLIGLIFGYVYTRTGKLRYNTGLHMITNFIGGFLAVPITKMATELEGLMGAMEENMAQIMEMYIPVLGYSMLMYALAIVGAVVFFVSYKRIVLKVGVIDIPKKKTFSTIVLNVGVILFTLACILEFVLSLL